MAAPEEILDFDRLEAIVDARSAAFATADPFPHAVIDDFLPAATANAVHEEFLLTESGWNHYHHYNEKKLALSDRDAMRPATRALFAALESRRFVDVMQRLSGIERLISDPALDGAGLHMIRAGGYLNVHTDFLAHTTNQTWSRQLNLLIYFNKDWQSDWRGDLELWSGDMRRCVHAIPPAFNRCVVFHTQEKSFHGHPHKLACPPDRARRSVALYYFRDEGERRNLSPTNYRPLPTDPPLKKAMVAADRGLLRIYSALKRYTGLSDAVVDKILKRF